MNLLHFSKFDLPEFPEGTPLVNQPETMQLPDDQTSFVRSVVFGDAARDLGLQKALQSTEQNFNRLIDRINSTHRIGAIIVPNTWGLLKATDEQVSQDSRLASQRGITPPGFALVAEVARVIPDVSHQGHVRHTKDYASSRAIEKVIYDTQRKRRLRWSEVITPDISLSQFMYGSLAQPTPATEQAVNYAKQPPTRTDNPTTILVDIGPRLRRVINHGKHKQPYIPHTSR